MTFRWNMVAVLVLMLLAGPAASERMKRPMKVHRVAAVGLVIVTEQSPEWTGRIQRQGDKAIYVVESPDNNYPPVVMNYLSFPEMPYTPGELEEIARGAIRQAMVNYRAVNPGSVPIRRRNWGILEGYEAVFAGRGGGQPLDVRVFVGAAPGKPLVAMHAYTLRGKMAHISENIRRAWSNVKYLE